MKISLEFTDLRDLLFSLPKFAQLVSSDSSFDVRAAAALEPNPETLRIQVTPENGQPFTANEKEALRRLLIEFVKDPAAFTSDADTVAARVVSGLKADAVIPEAATWAPGGSDTSEEAAPPWEAPAKTAPQEPTEAPAEAEAPGAGSDTPSPEIPIGIFERRVCCSR